MARDPLADMADAPLFVVPRMLEALRTYRAASGFPGPEDDNPSGERARLDAALDELVDRLLAGIERHPTSFWVMAQLRPMFQSLEGTSGETRQQAKAELERLLRLLGIEGADGVLYFYLDR